MAVDAIGVAGETSNVAQASDVGVIVCGCGMRHDIDYRAEPIGPNVYALYLTTHRSDRPQRHAELARRAAALCERPYQLTFHGERVTLCTDDCEVPKHRSQR